MNSNLLPKTVSPLKLHFYINFDFDNQKKYAFWYFLKRDGKIVGIALKSNPDFENIPQSLAPLKALQIWRNIRIPRY